MARITFRIDDALHDRLIVCALRSGRNLSDLIRPAIQQLAEPDNLYPLGNQDLQLAITAHMLSIFVRDIDTLSPESRQAAISKTRTLLLKVGMPQKVCGLAMSELEAWYGQ